MIKVTERFLKYVKYFTTSDPNSTTFPSSARQLELLKDLKIEMQEMGLSNVRMDKYGYVFATLPSNVNYKVPAIGLIAHVDTAPPASGENVKPLIHKNYQGDDIVLPLNGTIISPKDFPDLKKYIGMDIITASGDTLLGSDDKSGIAEILTAVEYLLKNPSIPHGDIHIGFTPDEEIGDGAKYFDVKDFGAEFAYTIDGEGFGSLEFENFNAASATITIKGVEVHPGYSLDTMINASELAMEFALSIPRYQKPWHTKDYEGFYLLDEMSGTVVEAKLEYILRDHNPILLEEKKNTLLLTAKRMNKALGKEFITVEITDSYRNMREQVEPVYDPVVSVPIEAMKMMGIEPKISPIRGGTDGARLSFMGLPCPNICAGEHNAHGIFEYTTVQLMEKICEIIVNIVKLHAEKCKK